MGTGSGEGDQCRNEGSVYLADVTAALNALTVQHPEWFDLRDCQGDRCRVRAEYQTAYHDGACAELRARGLCCSIEGGYEEIAIKAQGHAGNAFGEGWDILSGSGYVLRSYRGTCRPAWFAGGSTSGPPPSPGPSPTPTPAPSPTPTPCATETLPVLPPVAMIQTGRCSHGLVQGHLDDGRAFCVAESACVPLPGSGDKCPGMASDGDSCTTAEAKVVYEQRWGRLKFNEWGFADFTDGPEVKYQMGPWGEVYQGGVRPVRPFGDWTAKHLSGRWGEVCPPKRATCPSPAPTPTPSASPGATPSACPPLVCFRAKVHQHQTPEHQTWPHDWGLVGGWTNLDSNSAFGRCGDLTSCDDDHLQACGGRRCQDPRGPMWSKISGPAVEWLPTTPGDGGRGYGVKIGPHLSPGASVWRVCAPQDWRDHEGVPGTVGPNVCTDVAFEVRAQ